MDRLFERLGYASQWLSDTIQERAGAAREGGEHLGERMEEMLEDAEDLLPEQLRAEVVGAALGTAATFLASRYLTREKVRWTRAVLAGLAGTLAYDLVDRLDRLRSGGVRLDPEGLRAALAEERDATDWGEVGARYGAGVALAIFYASYLSHRLPGPAPVRGAVFGGLDAVALQWGGLLPLLERLHPELDLPMGIGALTRTPTSDPVSIAKHLAYGTVVGSAYG